MVEAASKLKRLGGVELYRNKRETFFATEKKQKNLNVKLPSLSVGV